MRPELAQALAEATRIRFLCSGNVVRSAFAELYSRHLGMPLPVDSAAALYDTTQMASLTRLALLSRGVDPAQIAAFRPRPIWRVEDEPDPRLVVLAMSRAHLREWRALRPWHRRSFLLLEVEGREEEVSDPVEQGADWNETFHKVSACVERLREHLLRSRGAAPAPESS